MPQDGRTDHEERISSLPVIVLGLATLCVLPWIGLGNAVGLGAGLCGYILARRRRSRAAGHVLCLIGACLNGLLLALVAISSATLVNCVGI